jgi:hypothetical protein
MLCPQRWIVALSLLASTATAQTKIQIGYRPPLLPIKIVADNTGVSIEGEASLVTPIGVFSLGVSVPIFQADDALRVIIRDRRNQTDRVYDVKWADTLGVTLNGRNRIAITRNQVILDVSQGGRYELAFNSPREADSRGTSMRVLQQSSPPNQRPARQRPSQVFRVTSRSYSGRSDLAAACASSFGPEFRVADWRDINAALERGVSADAIFERGNVLVTRLGSRFWEDDRHFIASRPIHPGYLVHEWSAGSIYALGSWSADYQLLCYAP